MKMKRTLFTLSLGLALQGWGVASALADTGSRDAQLQALAQEKLAHAKLADKVDLRVENSAATLTGTVDSIGTKERVTREISKVPGLVTVINNLQVADAAGGDDKLGGRIVHEIRLYPYYTIFDNIEASVDNGRVKLMGQVLQPWRKTDIERIVAVIPGVKEVQNDLEVLPLSPFDNELRWRIARAIYRDPMLLRYAIQALPPIHIIVKNGNVTLIGYVHSDVEKATAFRAARFAATYFDLNNQLVVETAQAQKTP
jgi:hyperosmotically inducible protein